MFGCSVRVVSVRVISWDISKLNFYSVLVDNINLFRIKFILLIKYLYINLISNLIM